MACNCKHNQQEIKEGKAVIEELRELFIKRMTVDSEHHDRRRKDYNQAIFSWWSDDKTHLPENTFQCWSEMNMDLVLRCFDDAVKDWRKTFCDVENCSRK